MMFLSDSILFMSSASPTDSSNNLLIFNSSDMAQINASNSSPNHSNDLDLENNEIPMNLLPAGNCEIFISIEIPEYKDFFFRNND